MGTSEQRAGGRMGTGPAMSRASRLGGMLLDRVLAAPSWAVALPVVALFLVLCALALALPGVPLEVEPETVVRPDNAPALFVLGVVCAAWGASAFLRCTDPRIRHGIHLTMMLCLFWVVITVIRYQVDRPLVVLWYLYYVPLTIVPGVMLACAACVAKVKPSRRVRRVVNACIAVSVALCVLVATNDLHHLAFVPVDESWPRDYAYGPVYAAVCVWIGLQIVVTLAILVSIARTQLRNVLLLLACLAVALGLFTLAYNLRVEFVYHISITSFFVSVYLLVFELCLRTGLFPSCSDYRRVFDELPLDLRLFSAGDDRELTTREAVARFPDMPLRARSALSEGADLVTFHPQGRDDLVSCAWRVDGGVAVLSEDIAAVTERRRQLEERQRLLRRQNEVLSVYRRAQTELLRRREEAELHRGVEESLDDATKAIGSLLDVLAPADPSAEPVSPEHRRHLMTMLKLLVSFCKRKGAIVLVLRSDAEFERDRVSLMVNETLSDLRTVGVDCAALLEVDEPLTVAASSVVCDCLYAFAFMAVACSDPTLMLSLRVVDGRTLELGVVLESDDVDELADYRARVDLERGLSEAGVPYAFRSAEKTLALTARMRRRG